MRTSDIEAWVLRVIDQQKRKQPCEDSRVEIKAKWPDDPRKAARQIAGHANAARGESVLWIIGIDESYGIVGAENIELANWFPQVKAHFNGLCPEVFDLNVPVDDKIVVALLFSTDRSPYVVKFSGELDVPWREGRRTRSANREDLLRLLIPISHQPTVEVLDAIIAIKEPSPNSKSSSCNWDINLQLYVTPSDDNRVVFPFHRCQLVITVGSEEVRINKGIRLSPPMYFRRASNLGSKFQHDSITIHSTMSEAIIDGSGRLNVAASTKAAKPVAIVAAEVMLALRMRSVSDDKPLVIETNLRRVERRSNERFLAKWEYEKNIE